MADPGRDPANAFHLAHAGHRRELAQRPWRHGPVERDGEVLALLAPQGPLDVGLDRVEGEATQHEEGEGARDAERREQGAERAALDLAQDHHRGGPGDRREPEPLEQGPVVDGRGGRPHRLGRGEPHRGANREQGAGERRAAAHQDGGRDERDAGLERGRRGTGTRRRRGPASGVRATSRRRSRARTPARARPRRAPRSARATAPFAYPTAFSVAISGRCSAMSRPSTMFTRNAATPRNIAGIIPASDCSIPSSLVRIFSESWSLRGDGAVAPVRQQQAVHRGAHRLLRCARLQEKAHVVERAVELERGGERRTVHPQDGVAAGIVRERPGPQRVDELRREREADDAQLAELAIDDGGEPVSRARGRGRRRRARAARPRRRDPAPGAARCAGRCAFVAGSPTAGSERRRPRAGRDLPSMGRDTYFEMRVWTDATPGSASIRAATVSGARSSTANTCANRCRS